VGLAAALALRGSEDRDSKMLETRTALASVALWNQGREP